MLLSKILVLWDDRDSGSDSGMQYSILGRGLLHRLGKRALVVDDEFLGTPRLGPWLCQEDHGALRPTQRPLGGLVLAEGRGDAIFGCFVSFIIVLCIKVAEQVQQKVNTFATGRSRRSYLRQEGMPPSQPWMTY